MSDQSVVEKEKAPSADESAPDEVEKSEGAAQASGAESPVGEASAEEVEISSEETSDDADEIEVTDDGGEAIDELEQLRAESAQQKDRMLRLAADFDNFKKRARRDLNEGIKQAENRVVLDFLPIIDNLERALSHGDGAEEQPTEGDDSLISGVRMVHKQFLGTLSRYQIEPFDAVGEVFDPELHEALQQLPSSEFARNTVMAEVQRGYRRGERLVRPAMVVVSAGPPPEEAGGESDGVERADSQGEAG